MKKLMAVLLALCLVVGMMPMMALADGGAESTKGAGEDGTYNDETPPAATGEDPSAPSGNIPGGDAPLHEPPEPPEPTYTADNIQHLDELIAALAAGEPVIKIGAIIDLEGDLTISTPVIIKGGGYDVTGSPYFGGSGTLKINANASFVNMSIKVPVEVAKGVTLTLDDDCVVTDDVFSGKGTVVKGDETIYAPETETPEPEEPEPEPEPGGDEDDPKPVAKKYNIEFELYPYWATVTVKYEDEEISAVNGKYVLEEGKTYSYTVSAPGFETKTKTIEPTKDKTISVKLDLIVNLLVWPYSHGSVWTEELHNGSVIAVHVEPDSGYYLKDLTVYCVDHGAIDYGRWYDGVYYFHVKDGEQYIIDADFAALPDEHRVYVEPTVNGDLSVDEVWAEEGEWVYITVKPDAGYRLDELTVTRPSGNEVKVYHVRDNVFRFKMPGVRVTVDAEFVRSSLPFSDVSRGQWFYDYVAWAYNTGLMEGVSAGRFAPNSTTTRAMVVTIIYRLAGSPGVSGTSDFTDVPADAWYADAVTWAAKRGIVEGMTATTFDPNDAVTREELAAMLYRYAKHKGYDTSAAENTNILSYNDAGSISEYAFEALQWACGEGIINGTGAGSLEPGGSATRAQLAAMLYRFCAEYVY